MGLIERRRSLFLFCFPFVLSEYYVVIASAFHGRLSGVATVVPAGIFGVMQIVLIAYLAYRLRGFGLPAWALTVFSVSYACFAYFAGQMAWTDTFL